MKYDTAGHVNLTLLQDDEPPERTAGFWQELFLLRPDRASLQSVLGALKADDLLQLQVSMLAKLCESGSDADQRSSSIPSNCSCNAF